MLFDKGRKLSFKGSVIFKKSIDTKLQDLT